MGGIRRVLENHQKGFESNQNHYRKSDFNQIKTILECNLKRNQIIDQIRPKM